MNYNSFPPSRNKHWLYNTNTRTLNFVSELAVCIMKSTINTSPVLGSKAPQPSSRVNFSQRLYAKKVYPFTPVKSTRTCSDCVRQRSRMLWLSRLDRVDLAGRGKVFYGEKLAWLGGWPYHHKRMNLARSATPSAEPTSCFVCKRFARIVRKWKVGSPRVALAGGWPFCLGQLFTGLPVAGPVSRREDTRSGTKRRCSHRPVDRDQWTVDYLF